MGDVRRWLVCVMVAGCRLGFEARTVDSGPTDSPPDSVDAVVACMDPAQAVPASGVITGTIAAGSGSAAGSCGGSNSSEVVFSIDVPIAGAGLLVATDTGNLIDSLLYVRPACSDTELACDQDGGTDAAAAYRLTSVAAGSYDVFVDGQNGSTGPFTLTAQVLLPAGAACGTGGGRERCAPELTCSGTCTDAGCAIAEVLAGSNSYTRTVDTSAASNLHAGSCGEGNDGGARAPEAIYQLQLATAVTNVHVTTDAAGTTFDTLIYVRHGCAGAEVACDDDSGTTVSLTSVLDTGALAAGDYDVFIDGFSTHSGTADVTITVTP